MHPWNSPLNLRMTYSGGEMLSKARAEFLKFSFFSFDNRATYVGLVSFEHLICTGL